jgi:hypothetical protein
MPLLFLLPAACAGFPFFQSVRADDGALGGAAIGPGATVQARVELQEASFDGETLRGRLLVSALEQSIQLDKRLIESIYLTTEFVKECDTGRALSFIIMDVLASRPTAKDILVLAPGYWFGKDVSIPLFTKELNTHPARPECIEARFAFRVLGGDIASYLDVRIQRSPKSPDQPDTAAVPE